MKTIIFKGISNVDKQCVQVKGGGLNKLFHIYNSSKLPGSFLLESPKTGTSYRVYCMLLDYAGWRFAISPAMDEVTELKDHTMDIKIDYLLNQSSGEETTFVLHIGEDFKVSGEGEFRE
jgi:hypothetical protein